VATDIKICGLTRSVDAEYADAAGVEYLGVIFAGGPRERTPAQARDTLSGRRARKAGVFADQTEEIIASVVELAGLDVVQLHGHVDAERVERVRAATGREVWAVVRTSDGALPEHIDELADASDAIIELRCTYDPESLTGATATRRVKGTIHWVSAAHARDAEVRLYDRLFLSEDPGASGGDPLENLNPNSLERIRDAKVEPALASAEPGARFQFERLGYFCADPDSRTGTPVFNRTVTLKDSWARIQGRASS